MTRVSRHVHDYLFHENNDANLFCNCRWHELTGSVFALWALNVNIFIREVGYCNVPLLYDIPLQEHKLRS